MDPAFPLADDDLVWSQFVDVGEILEMTMDPHEWVRKVPLKTGTVRLPDGFVIVFRDIPGMKSPKDLPFLVSGIHYTAVISVSLDCQAFAKANLDPGVNIGHFKAAPELYESVFNAATDAFLASLQILFPRRMKVRTAKQALLTAAPRKLRVRIGNERLLTHDEMGKDRGFVALSILMRFIDLATYTDLYSNLDQIEVRADGLYPITSKIQFEKSKKIDSATNIFQGHAGGTAKEWPVIVCNITGAEAAPSGGKAGIETIFAKAYT